MLTGDGKLKLNDFNKGRPLYWNVKTQSICTFVWPNNCGEEGAVTYVSTRRVEILYPPLFDLISNSSYPF